MSADNDVTTFSQSDYAASKARRGHYSAMNKLGLLETHYSGTILFFKKGEDARFNSVKVSVVTPRIEVLEDGKTSVHSCKTFSEQKRVLAENLILLSL